MILSHRTRYFKFCVLFQSPKNKRKSVNSSTCFSVSDKIISIVAKMTSAQTDKKNCMSL